MRPAKILIIDTNADMVARIIGSLRKLGFEAAAHVKHVGAIMAVREAQPDWILLDVDPPNVDCASFCDLVRKTAAVPKLRVLLYSAAPEARAREMVLQCGAQGHVSKEASVERITAKLEGFLRRRSMTFPVQELERLKALESYRILDTPAEKEFDGLARIASYVCSTPIALISFLDWSRQWFKANIGFASPETPRSIAFCAHAIHEDDVFEVPDATKDDRFASNGLVTSDPNIRFYAGAPIVTRGGQAVGTVCVIDRIPRRLSAPQRDALQTISKTVMKLLDLRRLAAERA